MSEYPKLKSRIDDREIIILDGAIGTQLQSMGVPMNQTAWASAALETHPFTVRRMHENYIAAGVDVITTNTYPSARHNLEPLGLGDKVKELNLRGVMLAQDARDRCAKERPVYIAGSVSNYGMMAGAEPGWRDYAYFAGRSVTSNEQAMDNLREQAEILVEAGVDFLIAESTGSTTQRRWVFEACRATGLPVWSGFKCRLDEDQLKVGYRSDEAFDENIDDVLGVAGDVVSVFHSSVASTEAAIPIIQQHWDGPLAVYPEADRHDYVHTYRDNSTETSITPEEFVAKAKTWVANGVQIVGGCCGVENDYIRPLRDALPARLS